MSNSPIISQYYDNTSFSPEENISLKSGFLHFSSTLAIAFNLLKKRVTNLFLPILVWQLVLFILFLAIQLVLIFGAINSLEPGTLTSLPTAIDQQTLTLNPAFQNAFANLLKIPAVLAYLSATGILFLVYILASTWIDFKTTIMLNDKSNSLFGSRLFLGRFWVLVLFLIVQTIVINSISDLLDISSAPAIGLMLSILSFVFSLAASYLEIIGSYIASNYLIEKTNFWNSFTTMFRSIKTYLLVDFFKQLLSFIFIIVAFITCSLVFGGLGLGLLLPLASYTASNSGVGIILIILFSLVVFLAIVFFLFLSWLIKCFVYVSYYNLRMLQLHGQPNIQMDSENLNIAQSEPAQTLEEKLMNNSSIENKIDSTQIEEISYNSAILQTSDILNKPLDQDIRVMEEYDLMDIGSENAPDLLASKPEPTIINPSHQDIIKTSNINTSIVMPSSEINEFANSSIDLPQTDDLQIIEGIGPKTSELLINNGINTFAKLADMNLDQIKAILEKGGARFASHNPANWPQQAELARDGKLEELEILKTELIRGL